MSNKFAGEIAQLLLIAAGRGLGETNLVWSVSALVPIPYVIYCLLLCIYILVFLFSIYVCNSIFSPLRRKGIFNG